MTVKHLINNNGNYAMNQFVIEGDGKIVFQSYASMIVEIDYNKHTITIGDDYNYSRTTGKHRNIFFEDYARMTGLATLKGLEKALKDGFYGTWAVIRERDRIAENVAESIPTSEARATVA